MKKFFSSLLLAMVVSTFAFGSVVSAFSDVSDSSPNRSALFYLEQMSIITGYPDGSFRPEKTVSRAEMTKILVGATGAKPTLETHSKCFPDVKDEWFAPFVCYAKEKGWVSGYADGTFKPGKEVSKVEAIKIIVNAYEFDLGSATDIPFDDTDKTAWYVPYLASASKKGLLETTTGRYGVSDFISRGEVSENIFRSIMVKDGNVDHFSKTKVAQVDDVSDQKEFSALESNLKVVKVVDGDTLDVDLNGETVRLRLIGIDTPETVDPRKPVQCFGKEASDRAKSLLNGKKVSLEMDSTQGDKDSYGRLLRYVILADGTNFNQKMIADGYAFEYTYSKPYRYQETFKKAQKSARESKKGLWAADTCGGEATDVEKDEIKPDLPASTLGNGKFYTSSHHTAKFYYCESDSQWKELSKSYLQEFNSASELLKAFPDRTLHEEC